MIIKSHIRGRFRDAAAYLKAQGENEKIRTVEISDIHASNLDEAFENMRGVASHSKAKKPLHHISINPYEDERLSICVLIVLRRRFLIMKIYLFQQQVFLFCVLDLLMRPFFGPKNLITFNPIV